jgi:diguanylate cyclase (GGDEF)-like protein/PAS domain S-box-containing protein
VQGRDPAVGVEGLPSVRPQPPIRPSRRAPHLARPAARAGAGTVASIAPAGAVASGHAALRQLASEVSGEADLARVFGEVVELSIALFGADKVGIWTVEPGDHPFRLAAHRGLGPGLLGLVEGLRPSSRTGAVRAMTERRMVVLDRPTARGTTAEMREAYRAEGIRTACLVPVVHFDEAIGVIGVYHVTRRAWPQDDRDLLEAFAAQAAVALQNARLHSSVEGFAARLDAIRDLAAELNRIHDVDEIGRAIVAQVGGLYDSDSARVYTVDPAKRMCEPLAFGGTFLGSHDPDPELLRVPVGTGLTGWVAQHGTPLRVADTSRERRARIVGSDDPESMLFAPMSYGETVVGVVVVSKRGVDRYTADDLTTLSIFAGFAAQALVNARSVGQLRAQQAELEHRLASQRSLLQVNETLLASRDPATVFERIADALLTVVRYDSITIYRLDRERGLRVAVLARDRYADEILADEQPITVGLTGWAITHGEVVVANEANLDPRAATVPGTPDDPEALVVVPLRAAGEVIGTLNVSRSGPDQAEFDHNEVELVTLFAGQASVAVQAVEARHAAEMRAERDALTGALNHGAFQADLAALLRHDDPEGLPEPFALLMLDLDGFKIFNDGRGHPAGDRFLVTAAEALASAVRCESGDRIYRYGGDEFAALLPGLGRAEARTVADRLEAAVAGLATGGPGPRVTISVGVATCPADGRTRDELVMNADAELYLEKAARRQSRSALGGGDARDGAEYLASLHESTYALLARRDPNELLETIVARAAGLVGSGSGYLYVVDQEADVLRVAVGLGMFAGWDGFELARGEGLAGRVWESGETIVVDEYASWAGRTRRLDGQPIGSTVGVPLTSGRDVVGVIGVASGAGERTYGAEDAAAIGRFAQLASMALENARLHAAARAEIAARERSEEELRAGSERLRRLADASFETLVIHRDGRILEVNRAFVELFGRAPSSVAGTPVLGLFPEGEREAIGRQLEVDTEVPIETAILLADGSQAAVELIGRTIPYADEAPARATAIRDIRERRAIEERLTRQSLYDGLTGLPNRSLFLDRTSHALARDRDDGAPRVAVLVLDLDRFKGINESFGHAVGDQIIAAVGRRFEDAIRPGDTLARLGGDEYAVLVTGGGGESAARSVAGRLLETLTASFPVEGRDTYLSVSVGIALADEGATAAGLLREAAIALDGAKADPNERIAVFTPAMSDVSIERLELEADLRRGLARDELEVFYQPLVDLRTGAVAGHEALARWRHPTRGLLGPYEFISLAEETGLIIPLGHRVLTEACRQARAWQLAFPSTPPLVVSVNLSARQLALPDLADSVLAALASTGLPASSLELEITETVAMRDAQPSWVTLRGLHDLGVRLALDDFGTGYSSLAYISRLPLDIIKVDRSFVAGLADSTANHSIIAAVSALARGLGIEVTAEGIERQEELEAVVRLGCDRGQGFLFAKPMPAKEAEAALARTRLA